MDDAKALIEALSSRVDAIEAKIGGDAALRGVQFQALMDLISPSKQRQHVERFMADWKIV